MLRCFTCLLSAFTPLGRHQLKNLGIKPEVIAIIVETWTQQRPTGVGTHIKFERVLSAKNGRQLRQVLVCSSSSSDRNWGRVVSRDFLKRERQKDEFLQVNTSDDESPDDSNHNK